MVEQEKKFLGIADACAGAHYRSCGVDLHSGCRGGDMEPGPPSAGANYAQCGGYTSFPSLCFSASLLPPHRPTAPCSHHYLPLLPPLPPTTGYLPFPPPSTSPHPRSPRHQDQPLVPPALPPSLTPRTRRVPRSPDDLHLQANKRRASVHHAIYYPAYRPPAIPPPQWTPPPNI